ncbi:hypothetical protein AAFF_G00093640 [Aldrovandia affinis]|uniref:SH3 domain-containing protein n=1 Tax=Aldrovandia affinis TaxID=143900 RepID=A0AAD7WY87_9TELE|nr:hypothetical protein AAFF_G00093640 [Aldrovandia affinis]
MQHIHLQTNEHFEVFTTIISPPVYRGRNRQRGAEKVVVAVNYQPCGPDELELCQGDVIRVLFRDDELWSFGRLQNGQQGYFPATHVTKFCQKDEPAKVFPNSLRRSPAQAETADVLGGSTE